MTTSGRDRSNSNLKRGNKDFGREVKGDNFQAARAAQDKNRASDARIVEAAQDSPDDAILELFTEASRAAARGLRKWNQRGGEPSRQTIEATREARQLAISAAEILRSRGRSEEAESFFAEMEARISKTNMGKGMQPFHCTRCGTSV